MELNKFIEHTLLKQDATIEEVKKLLDEAIEYNFLGVCVNPVNVKFAKEYLKNADIKLAILSNKAQEMTLKFYSEFLKDYSFDYVLGNINGAPLKPDPYGAEKILETLNVKKQYALLTGDGETDVLTAKNAAISSLSALWGFRNKAELQSAGATVFVEKPIEIWAAGVYNILNHIPLTAEKKGLVF